MEENLMAIIIVNIIMIFSFGITMIISHFRDRTKPYVARQIPNVNPSGDTDNNDPDSNNMNDDVSSADDDQTDQSPPQNKIPAFTV